MIEQVKPTKIKLRVIETASARFWVDLPEGMTPQEFPDWAGGHVSLNLPGDLQVLREDGGYEFTFHVGDWIEDRRGKVTVTARKETSQVSYLG